MKKGTIFILSLLFIAFGCNHATDKTIVTGTLQDADGIRFTLQEMDTHDIRTVDSVIPDSKGSFSFSPNVPEPGFWLIKAPTGKVLVMLLKEGDKINLSGSAIDFPDNIQMSGSQEAVLLNDFFMETRNREHLVDSLQMLIAERQDSSDFYEFTRTLDTTFKEIWESQRQMEIDFIKIHPHSLASLVVLNYAFGLSPVLSPEEDYNYYKFVDSSLTVNFPGNKHVKYHRQRVEKVRKDNADIR